MLTDFRSLFIGSMTAFLTVEAIAEGFEQTDKMIAANLRCPRMKFGFRGEEGRQGIEGWL